MGPDDGVERLAPDEEGPPTEEKPAQAQSDEAAHQPFFTRCFLSFQRGVRRPFIPSLLIKRPPRDPFGCLLVCWCWLWDMDAKRLGRFRASEWGRLHPLPR